MRYLPLNLSCIIARQQSWKASFPIQIHGETASYGLLYPNNTGTIAFTGDVIIFGVFNSLAQCLKHGSKGGQIGQAGVSLASFSTSLYGAFDHKRPFKMGPGLHLRLQLPGVSISQNAMLMFRC